MDLQKGIEDVGFYHPLSQAWDWYLMWRYEHVLPYAGTWYEQPEQVTADLTTCSLVFNYHYARMKPRGKTKG